VNTLFEQRQQVLLEQIAVVREKIAGLEGTLHEVDSELEGLSGQRQQFQLLGDACDSLNKLSEMGAASLFWGDQLHGFDPGPRLQRVSHEVAEFREKLSGIEQARKSLLTDLNAQRNQIDDLVYDLEEEREEEENAKYDFVLEREERKHEYRPMVMPWTGQEEDRRRFRKTLLLSLLFTIMFGGVPLVWTLPERDKSLPVEVPERLAKMIEKKVPPKPVEKVKEVRKDEPKKDETKPEKKEVVKPKEDTTKPIPTPTPTQVEVKQARAKAETTGVLAFKNSFKDLMEDMPSELGADARITNSGRQNPGGAAGTRSLIVAQGTGSGGIANFGISRGGSGNGAGSGSGRGGNGVGNGSGNAISGGGMNVGKATSGIVAGMGDADRPLSKGAGPGRTDEEIQIVFDRHKAALYRIYNRELRIDPTLRGKMVLALTIEPDGHVSACRVQSTDLNSEALSVDIVDRVKRFNFGEKEGVPTTKILYPIDFLPAG
jgi:outer membrane biosynthesis protein TonB